MGFKQSSNDPCVYVSSDSEFLVAVSVDDLILGGKNETRINEVKRELSQKFKIKDLGRLHYFLGVTVNWDQSTGDIWIGQASYTKSCFRNLKWVTANQPKLPLILMSSSLPVEMMT